ncbi:metal ABC transporter solute-binding protein, Zn/Mn family [Bifidobacterium aquikefiricola]|uniref:ZinT/AdcA family metal-binding protein n=1 Tax=Bifidobacterium aquikefiricola TaxID=3059038 RepID=A0AB39U545_9BIFI
MSATGSAPSNDNQNQPENHHPFDGAVAQAFATKRNKTIAIIAIAAVAVIALILGGTFFILNRNGKLGTTSSNQTVAQGIPDSCDTTLNLVASVNQWGSLAKELGGDCVKVTSVISSTSAEPHDYEATAADLATLISADIVVLNGAGYDSWAEKADFGEKQTVINIADEAGIVADEEDEEEEHEEEHEDEEHDGHAEDAEEEHHHHHGSVNPHLWFDPSAILKASQAITKAYVSSAGEHSKTAATAQLHSNEWNARYADFVALVNDARAAGVKRNFAATESIADYLMNYIGATNKTPQTYTNAVTNDAEPSASDLKNALSAVAASDVDVLIVNPQELTGFAKQMQEAAITSHKTIVSVTEQLPENQTSLLSWLTVVTKQTLANDTYNGFFLTQDVKDRSLEDYAGDWRSVYPLLLDGKLDSVMDAKAKAGTMTAEEYKKYYDTGYKTDVSKIDISGNSMTFTTDKGEATATYQYDGFKILDYAKGNRGVRYLFTATGDVPQGAPKSVQFSDHGIGPVKAEHFHIFMSDESQEQTLKEMDNWPTYYPSALTDKEIAKEMLAH